MSAATTKTAELIATLERVLEVLDRERRAVAAFQLEQLPELGEAKKLALDEVSTLAHAARNDETTPERKARIAQLFGRVQTQSYANMLLLHSVRQSLAASMGLVDEGNTYNARARRTSAYAQRAARAY